MTTASCILPVSEHSHFSVRNLPYGVFRHRHSAQQPRIGVAIGENVLDLSILSDAGCFASCDALSDPSCFHQDTLNPFMSLGRIAWRQVREQLQAQLASTDGVLTDERWSQRAFLPMDAVEMLLPARIGDYTDFYASKEHATNVGAMFRDPENALHPNWRNLPVAYHGRASSIVVSGTPVRRPKGQFAPTVNSQQPGYGPSSVIDFELEMACLIGPGNELGSSITTNHAEQHIFGLVLLNDWSARDVQKWEYVPLGPFNSKNWVSCISPWVVTLDALEPFRCPAPQQQPEVLPYLQEADRRSYNIQLEVTVRPETAGEAATVARSNFRHLYWTLPQMVAHHTIGGCNLRTGDLLGTGTISRNAPDGRGCLLELTQNGKSPVQLAGGVSRTYLQDGDAVTLSGFCQGDGYRVGFGEVTNRLLPAHL